MKKGRVCPGTEGNLWHFFFLGLALVFVCASPAHKQARAGTIRKEAREKGKRNQKVMNASKIQTPLP